MSLSVYSKFGTTLNDLNGQVGTQGPPGIGFVLTPGGNYDIQERGLENVSHLYTDSIRLTGLATNESATLLALDGDEVVKRTTFPNPFDQDLNTTDSVLFGGLTTQYLYDMSSNQVATIDNGSVVLDNNTLLGANVVQMKKVDDPGVANGGYSYLWNSGSSPIYNDDSGGVTDLRDPYGISTLATNSSFTDILVASGGTLEKRDGSNSFPDQNVSVGQSVSFDSLRLTGITSNTIDTGILVMEGDLVARRNGTNSFPNQSLNTTSDVTFDDITATTSLLTNTIKALDNTTCLQLNNVAVSIPTTLRVGTGTLQMTQVTNPGTPGGLTGYLWNNANVPTWTSTTGTTTSLLNPYAGQSPTFTGVSLSSLTANTTSNDIAVLNGNSVERRTSSNSFPNQALNSTSNVNFQSVGATQINTNQLTNNGSGNISLNSLLFVNTGTINCAAANSFIYGGVTIDNTLMNYLVIDGSNVVKKKVHHADFAESLGISSTTNQVTYQTKVTLTTTTIAAAYKIGFHCLAATSSNIGGTEFRVTLDGTPINPVDMSAPDSNTNGDYHVISGFWIRTLTEGSHTLLLQYRAQTAGTSSVQDARVYVESM